MKNLYLVLLLIFALKINAQDIQLPYKFGNVPINELKMPFYSKDSSANAVVLYEKALAKKVFSNGYILTETTFYFKIKIFNKSDKDYTAKSIYLHHTLKQHDKLKKLKVVTHNLKNNKDVETYLSKKNIYKTRESEYWEKVNFTAPNVENGSVIEIMYTVQSPFDFNFTGWTFQGEIPKVYSELHALIPGNWKYNKRLIGFRKLDIKEQKIRPKCFFVIGLEKEADCEDLTYAMKDVPAFKKEKYMTDEDNYKSRIAFELSEYHGFDERVFKYTKTWKDVDTKLKYEFGFGAQLKKIDYTKKLLPQELYVGNDTLKTAKKIYHYIQNYFKWDEKYHIFKDVDFKQAFKNKTGNATEINIALCNALNAAGIKSNLILISTRENGLPTYVHPILSDFNYAIVLARVGAQFYELDAASKLTPFGVLPIRDLNAYGRVLDFEKGSYWIDIKPTKSVSLTSLNLTLNDSIVNGFMRISTNAYNAINKRDLLINLGLGRYKKNFIEDFGANDLQIDVYRNKNLTNLDKPLIEDFKITFSNEPEDSDASLIFINPFFNKLKSNPFKLAQRTYPVDFGYLQSENYRIAITIPAIYSISSVPKNYNTILEGNTASLTSTTLVKGQSIVINYKISINKDKFLPAEYQKLKAFFKSIIDLQNEEIVLKKNN
ncbi:MAG: hypothetical protein QM486_08215 [Flavobacteriaceae bacterium]